MSETTEESENLIIFPRELMECPVCMKTMKPPIYQCSRGHSVCSECFEKLGSTNANCPTCTTSKLTQTRNYSLEDIAAFAKYPCQNEGCDEMIKLDEEQKHGKVCQFRLVLCNCGENVALIHLREHFKAGLASDHPFYQINGNATEYIPVGIERPLGISGELVILIEFEDELFAVRAIVDYDGYVTFCICHYVTTTESNDYAFTLGIGSTTDDTNMTSKFRAHADTVDDNECLCMPWLSSNWLKKKNFLDDEGCLIVSLSIQK